MNNIIGYLSPEGVLFPCNYWGHMSLAEKIVRDIYKVEMFGAYAEDFLLNRGWCVFYSRHFGFYPIREGKHWLLTKSQKYFLMDCVKEDWPDEKINEIEEVLRYNELLLNSPSNREICSLDT